MLVFFWILGAMGVAYGAKISARNAFAWFVLSLVITPMGGSVLLIAANRFGIRLGKLL